jgi:orotidine-5'-phosphate decarboxylase
MLKFPSLNFPYFLALDVDSAEAALSLAEKTKNLVGGFKIGPRLTYKYGADFTQKLSTLAPVFVDNKYHDIPSTMLAALQATFDSGASYATIHASCGPVAMKEISEWQKKVNQIRPFHVLSVTVLTSFEQEKLPKNWQNNKIEKHVLDLAIDISQSGLSGLVCSPHEVAPIKAQFKSCFTVVPGIRFESELGLKTAGKDDQNRVATPEQALQSGADALVVGRAILNAADPVAVAEKIANTLRQISTSL